MNSKKNIKKKMVLTKQKKKEIQGEKHRQKLLVQLFGLHGEKGKFNAPRNIGYIEDELSNKLSAAFAEGQMRAFQDEKQFQETIYKMLNEIIVGAYQNRNDIYSLSTRDYRFEDYTTILKVRSRADSHLLETIRTVQLIRKPTINVVVKGVEQVNVAEQQINIKEKSTDDLDKKYETIC